VPRSASGNAEILRLRVAVPQERDENKNGRLFAQDDTLSFINFVAAV